MRSAIIILLCLCRPGAAFAWGQEGHSIIAEIAQRRLSPEAAAMVEELLGRGHSLASVASWADDFRSTEEGKKTYNWHFADIPLKEDKYDKNRDCPPNAEKGDCVVEELNRLKHDMHCTAQRDLSDAEREEQARALKFAVHFVGDIHQPLHTVQDLTGGNGYEVGVDMQGATCHVPKCPNETCPTPKCIPVAITNLHVMWDSTLIQRKYWDWGAYVDVLEEGWLKSTDAQAPDIDDGSPNKWATETHGKAQIVWEKAQARTVLDDAYLNDDEITKIMDRQLGVAGLRLARFLNEAYASADCPTAH
jgi:hypothetical protein